MPSRRLGAVTQSVAAACGRALDRFPRAAPVVATIGLLGWPWVAIVVAAAAYALTRGTYGFAIAATIMVALRGLYVWAALKAQARHRAQTIGDPAVHHDGWLYVRGEPVRVRDWLRCARCRRRLRPGEGTVEGIAPVPAAAADLPQVLKVGGNPAHAGFPYCESCGGDSGAAGRRGGARASVPGGE